MDTKDVTHDDFLMEAVERFDFFPLDKNQYTPVKNDDCHKVFYESQLVTFVRTPNCYDPETGVACPHWQGVLSMKVGACSYRYDNMEWLLEIADATEVEQFEEVAQ